MRYYYVFFLIIVLFASCKKPFQAVGPEPPAEKISPTIIWKQVLQDDSGFSNSIDPILHNDQILTSSQDTGVANEILKSYNKYSGELDWTWEAYILAAPQRIIGDERLIILDNTLIASSYYDIYSIDLTYGNTNWATINQNGAGGISSFETSIFHTSFYGLSPHSDSCKIVMCDYLTGDWHEVFTVRSVDDFNPRIELPSVYLNQNGEKLLVFKVRGWVNNFSDRVDLYCYNLDQDSVVWQKEHFTQSGLVNIGQAIVEGDLIYVAGQYDYHCIEISSGEIIWTHSFNQSIVGSNFLLYNDLIIAYLGSDLVAIDINNGNQAWIKKDVAGLIHNMRIIGDRIYFTSLNKMYIVSASNGHKLYEFESPHFKGAFRNAISVDLENNKMYTSDGYYIMCMELPE